MSKTIESVQRYLKEVKEMTDRFLHDFSAAWGSIDPQNGGVRDSVPQSLHNETVALSRKDDSSGSLDGTIAYQWSDDSLLTLIGAGRQHLELSVAAQDQLQALLNARPVPAYVLQGPPAADAFLPGSNTLNQIRSATPPTNQQMSMRQNELALRAIKQRR